MWEVRHRQIVRRRPKNSSSWKGMKSREVKERPDLRRGEGEKGGKRKREEGGQEQGGERV